jgi:hypothetical protein
MEFSTACVVGMWLAFCVSTLNVAVIGANLEAVSTSMAPETPATTNPVFFSTPLKDMTEPEPPKATVPPRRTEPRPPNSTPAEVEPTPAPAGSPPTTGTSHSPDGNEGEGAPASGSSTAGGSASAGAGGAHDGDKGDEASDNNSDSEAAAGSEGDSPTNGGNSNDKTSDSEATAGRESDSPDSNGSSDAKTTDSESPTTDSPKESGGSGCVSHDWLMNMGYAPTDLVHRVPPVKRVFCPDTEVLGLPCGTEHHAVSVGGKMKSYGELCLEVKCSRSMQPVNTLWAFHDDSRNGICIPFVSGVRLFMHDSRYPQTLQVYMHRLMSAALSLRHNFEPGAY